MRISDWSSDVCSSDLATVTGERTVEIAGDPDHPANRGRLCLKGTHLGETVGLEGRLLAPMIGNKRASWDKALDLVAKRFKETIARHGPGSVAFYVSGQLLTEDYYVATIGRAHVCTPVTNAQIVYRIML